MTSDRLAELIGPLLGPAARDRLAALARGAVSDIVLRYDEVRDHDRLGQILVRYKDEIEIYDGEERFSLAAREP